MSKFCTNCGAKLEDDSVFCEECGTKVDQTGSSAENEYEDEAEYAEEEYPERNIGHQKAARGQSDSRVRQSGGGIPKTAIIAVVALLIAVVGAFSLLGGKGKTGSSDDKKPKTENAANPKDQKKESNSPYFQLKDESKAAKMDDKPNGNETTAVSPKEMIQEEKTDDIPQGLDRQEVVEEYPTVFGGEWDQADGIWFYRIEDEIVTNSWIEDNGKAYFVDDRGYMLTDCYTPDGYYVGSDGAYIPDADMGIVDIGSGNAVEIAEKLSTSDTAKATDFEWFMDYVLNGGSDAGRVITDRSYSKKVTDSSALNGGWKAFMFTDSGVYGSDVERYFNVEIDTNGSYFDLTVNWKYFFDPVSGSSVDETHTDKFEGSYNSGNPTAQSTYAKVDFDEFYISNDEKTEYAVGTFYWISGETDRIGLMRSAK